MAVSGRSNLRRLAAVAAGLILLSGCRVHLGVATEVAEDGSGEMAITVLLGETVRQTMREKTLKSDDPAELAEIKARGEDAFERGPEIVDVLEGSVPDGWGAERITEGKSEGLLLRASFSSLDEISGLVAPFGDWGDEIAGRQGADAEQAGVGALLRGFSLTREGSVFRFRAEPDLSAYEGADGGPNNLLATFEVSIALPGGVREHDADEEDDGTLTWHIPPGDARTISATSDLGYDPSEFPVLPVALGGGGALVAGLAGWWALRRRRASGGDDTPPPDPTREEAPVFA